MAHKLKVVKGKKTFSESFGMDNKLYVGIRKDWTMWLAFEEGDETGNFSESFMRFLDSEVFTRSGFKLETEDDYFLLGMIFYGGTQVFRSKLGGVGGSSSEIDLIKLLLKIK